MSTDLDELMKGFDTGDDIDFGFDIVSEDELNQKEASVQKTTEVLESNIQGINNLEGKLNGIKSSIDGVKQLLDFDEINIEGKLDKIIDAIGTPEEHKAELEKRVQEATQEKLSEVEKMILPLLYTLIKPENLQKNYIYWPNRKEVIERQIKKILNVTRGD